MNLIITEKNRQVYFPKRLIISLIKIETYIANNLLIELNLHL